jgi:predicted permease
MDFARDVRIAVRRLMRDRGFTIAASVVLALGLAATNTIFTFTYALFFRDLPIEGSRRFVLVTTERMATPVDRFQPATFDEVEAWRTSNRTFEGIGAMTFGPMNVADQSGATEQFDGLYLSANSFSLIGVRPLLGRDFRTEDDRPGAPPVVMLSERVWRTRFAGQRSLIGLRIRVNGTPATVIGVMPPGFAFPNEVAVWQPLGAAPAGQPEARSRRELTAFGRLSRGVTAEQAIADLSEITRTVARGTSAADVWPRIRDFRRLEVGEQADPVFSVLVASVGFVLLIACANVANLLLARSARRSREVSIRLAIGASRTRIVRELLVESALLSAVAGGAALVLSKWGLTLIGSAVAQQHPPYWFTLEMDWRVFGTFATLCVATVFLFGLLPAIHTARTAFAEVMSDGARGSTEGLRSRRWTAALVVCELALTIVLLMAGSLSIRDVIAETSIDAGVDTARLAVTSIALPATSYPEREQREAFYQRLDERLASLPETAAALASASPRSNVPLRTMRIEGRPDADSERRVSIVAIGPRYFATLDTRPLRGREFTWSDGARAAIVNERLAAMMFHDVDALGQRIRLEETGPAPQTEWLTIVGIVPNIRQNRHEAGAFDPIVYVPYAAAPIPTAVVMLNSGASASATSALLRAGIQSIDRDLPLSPVEPLEVALDRRRLEGRLLGGMLGTFATIAVVLAAIGLYAVTAFAVAQRTREIGVRMALGARTQQILMLVMRRASLQIALGVTLGAAGAAAVATILESVLIHVRAGDPGAIAGVLMFLVVITTLGCLVPARRAARLNPVAALRGE